MNGTIEFNGMITGDAKKFFYKKRILSWITLLVFIFVVSIVATFIGFIIMFGSINIDIPAFILANTVFFIISCVLAVLVIYLKKYKIKKISFGRKKLYIVKGKRDFTLPVSSIKQIVDYGEFYYIKLNFVSFLGSGLTDFNIFVCQKDLIVKASLSEFEKLFDNKIVRSGQND